MNQSTKREKGFRNILNQIDLGILIIKSNHIIYANQFFESKTVGFQLEEIEKLLQTNKTPFTTEKTFILPNGQKIWLEINVKDIVFEEKKCLLVILRDITQMKYAKRAIRHKQDQLDNEFLRNQKIESIGVLAGGIAHDYNNILTSILGNLELLNFTSNDEEEYHEILESLHDSVIRAKQLTNQLLIFSKGGNPVKKPESIQDLIKESANFILRGTKSKCVYYFEENLPKIDVDAGQINQVLNNIILNADQAMEHSEQALIKISAVNITIDEHSKIPLPNGKYVLISIQDNGRGIPKSLQNRIFDPYFTTKSKGNGLGLATTYSIIKHHGGYITFTSEPYIGTTFYIYLPVAKGGKDLEQKESSQQKWKFSGKILVLDDEKSIHMLLQRMCDQLGIQYEGAFDGTELMVKYVSAFTLQDPFDLVILDLIIPGGMGGKETARQLKSQFLEAKIIASSGYSNNSVLANYHDFGFDDILLKPYSFEEFQQKISRFLPTVPPEK